MKSKFGKTDPTRAELDQKGEGFNEERAQELLLQQSQAGKKKRPLIAKEKKAFDSADYFMKGDESEAASKGSDEQEALAEQEQIVNPHKSKLSSNFSNKIQEQQQEDSDEQEDSKDNENERLEEEEREKERQRERDEEEERERQRERQEQEERERQEQEERERIEKEEKQRKEKEEKQMREEQKKRAQEKEERERNQQLKLLQQQEEEKMKQQQQNQSSDLNEEEIMLKQQEAMMLKMKGNTAKKPLVAKQKKAFDSADYFMKDEHKDSEVEGTESDTIEEQSNNNGKAGESKSKYGQKAKEKKSSDSDNSPKSADNFAKVALPPPSLVQGNSSEGQSPRGALKSRSGSESRESQIKETKRVSFSLPADGQESATAGAKLISKNLPVSSGIPQSNTVPVSASTFSTTAGASISNDDTEDISTFTAANNNTINNVHSLKGSRFLSLPNNIQQESDSEKAAASKETEDIENQYETIEQSNPGMGNEELERLYNEQLNQAEARLVSGGKKKKPLIAKDKRKDFDSADYFLQQELKKRESAASMFEFGDIDDDSHKTKLSSSSKTNGNITSSRSKSDYKKTASMPEFQDDEKKNSKRTSKIRESSFNRQDDLSQSSQDNNNSNDQELEQNYDDDDEDDDEILSNKIINLSGGLSTAPNGLSPGSSFDDEEDFLPKITHSKISNSRFQVYKNHHESDDEDEKDKQKAEQERLAKLAQEEQENIEKQKQLEAIQNENNRISAAQSEALMQEQSKGLSQADKYDQFALPLPKHKKNLLSKEKKKEFDSADYFMKEK